RPARKEAMENTSPQLRAFKRGPSLELSKWYMGMLMTNLAESKDTNGAFFLMEAIAAPGTEPPPHVHTREDELFYALEGKFDMWAGKEACKGEAGEPLFCPKSPAHGFAVRSPQGRALILVTPGGLEDASRSESLPPQKLDLPTQAPTYST